MLLAVHSMLRAFIILFPNSLGQQLFFFMFYLQFAKDANEIMQMLLANQAQFEQISADDPQVCKLLHLTKVSSFKSNYMKVLE